MASTQFGWKKKTKVPTTQVAFGGDDDDASLGGGERVDDDVDWLTASKRKHGVFLEDSKMKSERLKDEGNTFAEEERYWEAIKRWDEALVLTPDDATLHELKSQAYSAVGERFPSVHSAEESCRLDPVWYVARQRLGRAQMDMGEVELALTNFQKAVHLHPADPEIWKDDLLWAWEIAKHKRAAIGDKPEQFPVKTSKEGESEDDDDDDEDDYHYEGESEDSDADNGT
eukprot:scpid93773/ scgid7306/ Tetratricopeptide repeat protein 33